MCICQANLLFYSLYAHSELTICGRLTYSIWELHNVNIHYGVIFVVESDSLLSFEVSALLHGLTSQHKETWKEFEEDCISSRINRENSTQ